MPSRKVNYAALAEFLGRSASLVSLRRFRELQVRSLLFYQAELSLLEAELHGIEELDGTSVSEADQRVNYRWVEIHAQYVQTHITGMQTQNGDPSTISGQTQLSRSAEKYVGKMIEIRDKLQQYNEALASYHAQDGLPSPSKSTVSFIRSWLDSPRHGNRFINQSMEDVWDPNRDMEEMLTFHPQGGLTKPLGWVLLQLKILLSRDRNPSRIVSVDDESDSPVGQAVSTVVSSALPVIPIIVLYFIKSAIVRIVLILVFTVVFATVLACGLKLPPEKVLAITTAIAAVQVVYVGSTTDSTHVNNS